MYRRRMKHHPERADCTNQCEDDVVLPVSTLRVSDQDS